MGASSQTPIASFPLYLDARVWHHRDIPDEILEVLKSPILSWLDEECQPVYDYLSSHCTRERDWATVEDPAWMGGEYRRTEHLVYASCPSDSVDHNCFYKKQEASSSEALDG